MIQSIKSSPLILVLGTILFTCRSRVCVPDEPLIIQLVDSNGRNLFDYSTPNHYSLENVKLFNFTNKVKVLYATYFKGTLFVNENSIMISFVGKTMLLELNPTVTDTITCTQSGYCPVIIDKAWYNGALVYDRVSKFQYPVVIVK